MKTIIAGSRCITGGDIVRRAIEAAGFKISEIVSGGARGPDSLAILFAGKYGIKCKIFPAEWTQHGKGAGPIRNRQMAEYADALIAIWDGKSRGTKNMIETMEKMGKPVFVMMLPMDGESIG